MLKGFILSAAAGVAALFGLSATAALTGVSVAVNAASILTAVLLGLPGIVTVLVTAAVL